MVVNTVQDVLGTANDDISSQLLSSPTALQRIYDFANQFSDDVLTNANNPKETLADFLNGQTVKPSSGQSVTWNGSLSADQNLQNWYSATGVGAAAGGVTRSNAFDTAVASETFQPTTVE